ncbi:hypothetical protein SAMN03159355_02794 [Pseudomonas sp. NFPP10]|nr:hypothetical protein SAMN03159465_03262 [Pseudomonas sp. NFPP12]SEL56347.1 hypothetical protein SAMN03159355_02794 [Pseudomonas sp. NFPP10]SFJ24721.1 hypothetical protein SAMN03159416_03211 [Pseudomonas sp. NFPP08]SFM77668.1 hypothetical protein SAMN03159476_02844 [Pseudomonas sp. NFPP05]SFX55011.1 hypothetical protein SAMN03159479_02794 [Pseudomonas sp. NFPP09]
MQCIGCCLWMCYLGFKPVLYGAGLEVNELDHGVVSICDIFPKYT